MIGKKLLFFILVFGLGFVAGTQYKAIKKKILSPRFRIAQPIEGPCTEKSIVILTLSYNNEAFVKRNIESVISQNYSNYKVI